MKKIVLLSVALAMGVSVLASCTNRDMATVGGAAVGGVAGNLVTGGSGVGTAVGAVGGGLIGNQMAR